MTLAAQSSPTRTQRVELILAQIKQLPTLPAVATRLLQMTADTDSDTKEVIRLIESDPSLAAKILSLVQRASAGVRLGVATVEKAVVMMGFEAVRNTVLTIKIFETFGQSGDPATAFDRREFWKHSLAVACAARMLATQLQWKVDPEEAFVCGLLHDMGKVALDACLPKSYDRVVRQAMQRRANIADVEKQLLGLDHTVAGRRLAQLWALPDSVVECVWLHHHPPESLPRSLKHAPCVRIVHVADLISRELHVGFSGNHLQPERPTDVARRLEMPEEAVQHVQHLLAPEIEDRANLIGLDSLTSNEVYLDALTRANEELGNINSRLASSNQRLRLRDRYLDSLGNLNSTLSSRDVPSQVCRVIAKAWRDALTLPAIAVYSRPSGDGLCAYALSGPEGELDDVIGLDAWDPADARFDLDIEAGISAGICAPADSLHPTLMGVFGPYLDPQPGWIVPLVHDGDAVGGVLFAADRNVMRGLSSQRAEIEMLAISSALMLASAQTRLRSEQLADELGDANRRLCEAQEALLRKRSLSMIAEMAGGAAHELNTPLAVISGRAQLLATRPEMEPHQDVLQLLCDQAHKCSEIVSELMDFAKPTIPKREHFTVGPLLSQLRSDWLERTGWPAEAVTLESAPDVPNVFADPKQVRAALDELVANAVDASGKTARRLQINCDLQPVDGSVVVTLRDSGCGMTADVLERAHDPFFSHRQAGRGRGLGLSRAVRWLEINDAQLRLESEPGHGTTARVILPTAPRD